MNNKDKKASKLVTLVLISSVLSSCVNKEEAITKNPQKIFMRADSTAPFTDVTQNYTHNNHHQSHAGIGNSLLWYMAFRNLTGGMGYSSTGIHQKSNIGTNYAKDKAMRDQAVRGGFGSSSSSAAS